MQLLPRLVLGTTLLSAALAAQSTPCFATNDQNTNISNLIYSSSFAGPGVWAWQITPTSAMTAESLRIFTRNTYATSVGAFMTLEIWDEDPATPGEPHLRLAGGTWQHNATYSWQGADLDAPVGMQANTPYWVVLTEPGWSTPPIEPAGATTMPYRHLSGGVWSAATSAALKVRIFCGPLDDQGVAAFGPGCADSTGSLASLFSNQPPQTGNADFRIEGSGFPAGAPTLCVFGLIPGFPSVPIGGTNNCYLNTNWDLAVASVTGTGNVRAATAYGHVAFAIPVAANPALVGFYFSSELIALDAASSQPLPFVASNGLQVTVF